ncbi:ABC transporter ATP-binding protein [Spirochaeta cellobiosiphila]|uniref:ABC transporter ATP-binding protein n=1 Tax=Spirochaeta cellobiosiphila TaxID=504483 RepID=UPI0003F717CA|nr:ABC transporter ATP-binding protein [Spirochaeta cellobiosiphila]
MVHLFSLPENTLAGMWRILKGYRLAFLTAMLCSLAAIIAQTSGQFLIKTFVDSALDKVQFYQLAGYALGYIGIAVIQGVSSFGTGKLIAYSAEGSIRIVRNALYDHLQKLSFTYHDNNKTGELIQRATSDVDSVRKFFGEQIPQILRVILQTSINFGAILILDKKLGLISVAFVPIILALSWIFFGRIHKAFMAFQDQEGAVSAVLQENLSGVRVVRAFARKDHEIQKFHKENETQYLLGKTFNMSHAIYWPFSHIVCSLQTLLGLGYGAWLAYQGEISLGTFIAYMGIVDLVIWPFQHLGRQIAQLSTSAVSYKRIKSILDNRPEDLFSGREEGTVKGHIIFNKVGFHYEEEPVLKNIDLDIAPGMTVAIMGEAGSGKTSLVNLLPRFYNYNEGQILLDGIPLEEYSRHFLRRHIGMVEQEPFLFSASIHENIAYGVSRDVSRDEVIKAAKLACIHHNIEAFPEGYDTMVGERGVTLSGGQKQRIAIARTILKNPSVLILDDSTSAVDAETEELIRGAIKDLRAGRTSFIIAHRLQSLRTADLILVMKEGRIIQQGTHEELIDQKGFYQDVYNLQNEIEVELQKEMQ